MNISSHQEYGLRCAIRLAWAFRRDRLPLPASHIAEIEGLSTEYVSKLMHLFRKAGLMSSVRGIQGGFRLSRKPEAILLHELFEAVSPTRLHHRDFCESFSGKKSVCVHIDSCSARPVWSLLQFYFDEVVGALSLGQLLAEEGQVRRDLIGAFDEQISEWKRQLSQDAAGLSQDKKKREGSASLHLKKKESLKHPYAEKGEISFTPPQA